MMGDSKGGMSKLWAYLVVVVVVVIGWELKEADGGCTCTCVSDNPLRIMAFNIQIFGITKMSKPHVVAELIRIVEPYDIILIMEIRDASQTAIYRFLDLLNGNASNGTEEFKMALSERQGRTHSKEQAAYIYKSNKVTLLDAYDYDDGADTGDDPFEREPFLAKFSVKDPLAPLKEFGLIGIHTDPDHAETEIDHLITVYENANIIFNTSNILLMGDLNADCSYMTNVEKQNSKMRKDQRFVWLIDDKADTTTSSTNCAYDRFIAAGPDMIDHALDARIVRYDLDGKLNNTMTRAVSDHYPIAIDIK